jgi:hypothetical protein
MPTGFTAPIENDITFREFALRCARGLTVLMQMHEDPLDKPIPDKFLPSGYHTDELQRYRKELYDLERMSHKELDDAAKKCYAENLEEYNKYRKQKTDLRIKYMTMLDHVKKWSPPTEDHEYLKKFMTDQIEESIRFDCTVYPENTPKPLSGDAWKKEKRAAIIRDIAYHTEEEQNERDRAARTTRWVKELRDSLPSEG